MIFDEEFERYTDMPKIINRETGRMMLKLVGYAYIVHGVSLMRGRRSIRAHKVIGQIAKSR